MPTKKKKTQRVKITKVVPVLPPAPPPIELADQLTDKERLFVMYYCGACHFNGAKAARWAGYADTYAREQAYQNLTKLHIQKAIKEEMGRRASSHDELVRDIIEEYCKLAFSNITSAVEFNALMVKIQNGEDLPAEVTAAIKAVNMTDKGLRVEFHDKRGALADLAKIMGMLTDDFRVRPDTHENIVERLYKKRLAEKTQLVSS